MSKTWKLAQRELERAGAQVQWRGGEIVVYLLPTGKKYTCNKHGSLSKAREVAAHIRSLTPGHQRAADLPTVDAFPHLTIGELILSNHFRERCDLMMGQGLTVAEIAQAITSPKRVRDVGHGKLLFCDDRVGVVVGMVGGLTAVTLLWLQDALWEAFPRDAA